MESRFIARMVLSLKARSLVDLVESILYLHNIRTEHTEKWRPIKVERIPKD